MFISSLRGDLPPAFSMSFIIDAAGVIPVASGTVLYVTARPATKAAVTSLYLRGRRCTAAANAQNRQTPHVLQPLLHSARRLRIVCSVVNRARPWRCTAGVTPASTRTRDRWTEARTDCHSPLYHRNGKRPRAIQKTWDDTSAGPHEDPLTASSGRPSDERVTGRGPGV